MFGFYFVVCFFFFNVFATGFTLGMIGEPKRSSSFYRPFDAVFQAAMATLWGFVAYSLYILI